MLGGEREDVYVLFFEQKTADEISACLVGAEMCISGSHVQRTTEDILTATQCKTPTPVQERRERKKKKVKLSPNQCKRK